jgi:hypothetical protein
MNHIHLTCKHHSNLRWNCKSIAYTEGRGYNGARNIFFNGELANDGSNWPYRDTVMIDGQYQRIAECNCPPSDLILAPESSQPDYS